MTDVKYIGGNPVCDVTARAAIAEKADADDVGDLSQLTTTAKDNLVSAVTEINGRLTPQQQDLYWNDTLGAHWKSFSFVSGTAHSSVADTIDFFIPAGKTIGLSYSAASRISGFQVFALHTDGTNTRLGLLSGNNLTWTGSFTITKDTNKIGIYIGPNNPDSEITFSIWSEHGLIGAVLENEQEIATKMTGITESLDLKKNNLVSGSLQTATMTVSANGSCVSYLSKIPVTPGEKIRIVTPNVSGVASYRYRFGFYDADSVSKSQITETTNNELTVGADVYFISFMIVGYDSSDAQVSFNLLSAMSETDTVSVAFLDRIVPTSDFALKSWVENNFQQARIENGVVKTPGGFSLPVASTFVGSITYLQAFCVYDGKYYSIDGSNIAEQDTNFNVLRNVALSTGHCNSLQLGHNGKAYASGWDDGKIYVVNLSTLAVESVITIPTTGYFSAVVDDLNDIAYIIHRDSYPNTVETYTFSVFDITQNQIISTRKINAFGALQAADFYNGNILVIYGLGSTTVPNGMTIYNSVGDIVSTFDLDVFDITETEGCAFDRESDGIYVSLYNKQLYKVY